MHNPITPQSQPPNPIACIHCGEHSDATRCRACVDLFARAAAVAAARRAYDAAQAGHDLDPSATNTQRLVLARLHLEEVVQ